MGQPHLRINSPELSIINIFINNLVDNKIAAIQCAYIIDYVQHVFDDETSFTEIEILFQNSIRNLYSTFMKNVTK